MEEQDQKGWTMIQIDGCLPKKQNNGGWKERIEEWIGVHVITPKLEKFPWKSPKFVGGRVIDGTREKCAQECQAETDCVAFQFQDKWWRQECRLTHIWDEGEADDDGYDTYQ